MNPTSGVLEEAWSLYKNHWQRFVILALAVYVVVGLITAALISSAEIWGAVLATVVSLVGVFLLQGAFVHAVLDVRDGRVDMTVGETLAKARPYLGSIAGASLLAGLGIALGLILLLVPGFYLLTIWVLIVPVIVLEDKGAIDSFARSREIVTGYGWSVFGLIVLTFLIQIVVGLVIGLFAISLPEAAGRFVADLLSGAIAAPFVAITWVVLYFRLVNVGDASR
jgi:hypothetical protein